MILNMIEGKPLPVYGQGLNVRDWLYVTDHAEAIWAIVRNAPAGETYNVGGENEWKNIDLVKHLCEVVASSRPGSRSTTISGSSSSSPTAPGTITATRSTAQDKATSSAGRRRTTSPRGLAATVAWYLGNTEWISAVRSGEYRKWIETNYSGMNRA